MTKADFIRRVSYENGVTQTAAEQWVNAIFRTLRNCVIDNPLVKKKVVEIKQREMLKKLFFEKDLELLSKLDLIKQKYLTYKYHSSIT